MSRPINNRKSKAEEEPLALWQITKPHTESQTHFAVDINFYASVGPIISQFQLSY